MLGAAHKPGAIPVRPLSLGEMYDGAFKIIRFNPKATVGSALLVSAITMSIPVLATIVLTWTVGTSFDMFSENPVDVDDLAGTLGAFGAFLIGAILQFFGLMLVTGMICHVTAAAAVGKRLDLASAWEATKGKRWALIGLSVLLWVATLLLISVLVAGLVIGVALIGGGAAVLFALVWCPAALAFMVWFWIKVFYLPIPALMLEPQTGVTGAIGRGYRLTGQHFWRVFGIALLTVIVTQIAGSIISTPFSIIGLVVSGIIGSDGGLVSYIITNALATVLSSAFTAPFLAAVVSLQYLDLRMRKEAYDVELMTQAGIIGR